MPKMKVHAFRLDSAEQSDKLIDVLSVVKSHSLSDRLREVSYQDIRAEHIELKNGLWFIDFVKIRKEHGPGKVGKDKPIEGFTFATGQGFGEETAMIYNPNTGYAVIQYNHYGVRSGSIQDYFSAYTHNPKNSYHLNPVYDSDVERRLATKTIIKNLSFKISSNGLTAADRRNLSLGQAIDLSGAAHSGQIKIEFCAGRKTDDGLNLQWAKNMWNDLRRIHSADPSVVSTLEVAGKNNRDVPVEVMDLLAQRLIYKDDVVLGSTDLRFTRDSRFDALLRAFTHWRGQLT